MRETIIFRHAQAGVTLIEAIIFLSLLSVVLGVVLNKARIAFSSNRAVQSADAAQLIAAGVRSAYQLRNNYTGLTTATALANGLVPDYMVDGARIINVWGGNVDVVATTTPATGFNIVFKGVPPDDCAKFVNSVSISFDQVQIKTQKVKPFAAQGAADPQAVGQGCRQAGTPDITLFSI